MIPYLASLLPFPVCEVEVVVYVGLAVLGVPEHGVEEGLGGEQRVAEHRPQAPHQLVPGETKYEDKERSSVTHSEWTTY